MLQRAALIFLGCAPVLVLAQETTTVFRLQGSEVGRNTYLVNRNGQFKSDTTLTIGPTKIISTLEGERKDGKIIRFKITEDAGAAGATVEYEKGTVIVTPKGKAAMSPIPLKWDEQYILTTFHPQVMAGMLERIQPGTTSKLNVLEPNQLRMLNLEFKASSETTLVKGSRKPFFRWKTSVSGVEIEMLMTPESEFLGYQVRAQQFQAVKLGAEDYIRDPMAAFPELSQPKFRQSDTIQKALTPMRDGVVLATTVITPKPAGKYPVILMRTPYGREVSAAAAPFWVERGYTVVVQDTRGRGDSGGTFDPFNTEVQDGFDTLEWIKNQPWCDGNIGMIGASYGGSVQWSAAVTHHPNLKCIIPQVSPPEPVRNVPWDHGVFLLGGNIWWARIVMDKDADLGSMQSVLPVKGMLTTPLSQVDNKLLGRNVPFYDAWLSRSTMDKWKGAFSLEQVAQVKIPVMHVSGYWDGDGIGTKLHWEALRANKHNSQWLVFGPWSHAFNTTSKLGGIDYGSSAILDLDPLYLRFFDTYLKGMSVKMDAEPKVRMFFSGANTWLKLPDWPAPSSRSVTWNFAGGKASGSASKGELSLQASKLPSDSYDYDPMLVAKHAKDMQVGDDSQTLFVDLKDARTGYLIYKTKPFESRTALSGPTDCELYVSTSARDGNFHIMLGDQRKDGRIQLLGMPGNHRLTWTPKGFRKVKPGEVVKLTIRPWEFAHVFEPGHRLVVMVSSDAFPTFARNPGTGEPDATATRMVKATHTIHRSAKYPSRIRMRIMEW